MNIGFFLRHDASEIYGGDITCLELMAKGLEKQGFTAKFSTNIDLLLDCHFVFLTFSLYPLLDAYLTLKKANIPFAVIPFYENDEEFFATSRGLSIYLELLTKKHIVDGMDFSLETLIQKPSMLDVFGPRTKLRPLMNRKVFEKAKFCLTNSPTEKTHLLRDFDNITAETIFWPAGQMTKISEKPGDEFLTLTGLKSKSYMLQVGRIETRKNQLTTALATRNLEMPLVFIASRCNKHILELLLETLKSYRKGKTIILSPELESKTIGNIQIIGTKAGYKLPKSLILSAYQHAGIYIHPAFQELPGLTYLEALHFNIPIIASQWTTLKDYLSCPKTNEYLLDDRITFCRPHHIQDIETAIRENFGKTFSSKSFPNLKKTYEELGLEAANLINKYTG